MKKLLIAFVGMVSFATHAQQPQPTPSYNLLNYKIAELYKRAADEYYIQNDLTQSSPLSRNYDQEKELYKKAIFYSNLIDTSLLFKDAGFQQYCSDIGLGLKSTFLLFREELRYRDTLAKAEESFFVFDPRRTLEQFDTTLTSQMDFYLSQLKELDVVINDKTQDNALLAALGDIHIKPSEADAREDIKIAEANERYYADEMQYHNSITNRYEGLLTASIQRQKAISQAIQKDLQELDDLSKMNANLLASAISSYTGLPDFNQVNNFIKNPNLKQAVDLALSNGGSKLAEELGKAASWGNEALEAYNKVRSVYEAGKKYYETATEVVQFIQNPNLDNFIATAKKVANASGREDLSKLAEQLEKGKNLWATIKGCAGNFTCECFNAALQAAGQNANVKKYLDTLRSYNFNCESLGQLRNLIEKPSFEALANLAADFENLTGFSADEIRRLKALKDSLQILGKHSGFEKYVLMGEMVARKLTGPQFEQFKNEMLDKKPLALLYDLLLSKKQDYSNIVIDNLLPDNGNSDRKRLRNFLLTTIKDRSMTGSGFVKSLCITYPEYICDAFPAGALAELQKSLTPPAPDCATLVKNAANNEFLFREMAFVDSSIKIRGRTVTYDGGIVVRAFINSIVNKVPVDAAYKPFIKEFMVHAIPSLRGSVQLPPANAPATQATLFTAMVDAGPANELKNDLTYTYLGLYSTGKLNNEPAFQSAVNAHANMDSINRFETVEAGTNNANTEDLLKNMLLQGAVNYFAPGAMQALQIVSNLFKQNDIADQIRDKNKELQETVRDYVDKNLEKDKYQINAYRAEHERLISSLVAEGKRTKLNSLVLAGNKLEFKKQLVKEQIGQYSSYYYYLMERLRETFTKYLWAFRKWYGTSYQDDVLKDPNSIRLILDPQIRYLTFFNYTDLGKRKGTEIVRQWEKILAVLKQNHPTYIIDRPDEAHLSEFSAHLEDIAPREWDDFKKWIVSDNKADNYFSIKLPIDLLDKSSTDRWTIGMGDKLQRKLMETSNDALPFGLRLLGVNVMFIDTVNNVIRPADMFITIELKRDSAFPTMINYGDRFIRENYGDVAINLRNFTTLNRQVAGKRIDYFKSFWGIPLQSGYVLSMSKNLNTNTSSKTRKKLGDVRIEGFYFTNQDRNFTRSISDTGELPLTINGVTVKIPFTLADVIGNNRSIDEFKVQLDSLQNKINQP